MTQPRRDRQKQTGRRPPFRRQEPTILVVSEGLTEKEYLDAFWKASHNPRVTIEVVGERGVPKTVVEVAKEEYDKAIQRAQNEDDDNLKFDSVWCVYDVDDHPHLSEAREMAAANGFETAISNPSFELWLLLHFRDDPGSHHRDTIKSFLKKYDPGYDKHVDFDLYAGGYEQGAIRARTLDKIAAQIHDDGRNPTTGVYRLTELIRGTYPEVRGTWWIGAETECKEILTVVQTGDVITANCFLHDSAEWETRWILKAQVWNDGQITGHLEYPSGDREYRFQKFSGRISQDGRTIKGRAEYEDGGGHNHLWSRIGEIAQGDGIAEKSSQKQCSSTVMDCL
jgi:hypothetical protein